MVGGWLGRERRCSLWLAFCAWIFNPQQLSPTRLVHTSQTLRISPKPNATC